MEKNEIAAQNADSKSVVDSKIQIIVTDHETNTCVLEQEVQGEQEVNPWVAKHTFPASWICTVMLLGMLLSSTHLISKEGRERVMRIKPIILFKFKAHICRAAPAPPARAPDSPESAPELPPGSPGLARPASRGPASHLLEKRPPGSSVPNIQVQELISSSALIQTNDQFLCIVHILS